MKHFILKSSVAVALGLSLTLSLLGIMSQISAEEVEGPKVFLPMILKP